MRIVTALYCVQIGIVKQKIMSDNAVVILRIEAVDQAIQALQAKGVNILSSQEIYTL